VTVGAALEDVAFHLEVAVFRAEVNVGGEHHLDVRLLLRELAQRSGGGGVGSGHGCASGRGGVGGVDVLSEDLSN